MPRYGRRSTHVGQVVSHSRFGYTRGTLGFKLEVSINLAWFYQAAFTTQQHIINSEFSALRSLHAQNANVHLPVNYVDTHKLKQELYQKRALHLQWITTGNNTKVLGYC